jgi:hypothetical protein
MKLFLELRCCHLTYFAGFLSKVDLQPDEQK